MVSMYHSVITFNLCRNLHVHSKLLLLFADWFSRKSTGENPSEREKVQTLL